MRIRLVLGAAVVLAAAGLALDMSRAAPRTAGSDHVAPLVYSPPVPANGTICQTVSGLPRDAARVTLTVASIGGPVPALDLRFLAAGGQLLATGSLPAGARPGTVSIPVRRVAGGDAETASEACVSGRGGAPFSLGGEGVPVNNFSARIGGSPTSARVSLIYFRAGRESWWQLLPTLAERVGFGKASFVGSWLLLVCAAAMLLVWAATIRLLARELR